MSVYDVSVVIVRYFVEMGFYGKRLVSRLRQQMDCDVPDDLRIRRCNPGWSTLSAGGFKWTFESYSHPEWNNVGSQYTVCECAMAEELFLRHTHWGDTFIDIFG